MRKHQFVKTDCNCLRKATYLKCKHCGAMEYGSPQEVRMFSLEQATCSSPEAPEVPKVEVFKCKMGATLDCLAPDYETWSKGREPEACIGPDCPGTNGRRAG